MLLLHEIELVLEHCPPEALADLTLRNLLIDTMTSCTPGNDGAIRLQCRKSLLGGIDVLHVCGELVLDFAGVSAPF